MTKDSPIEQARLLSIKETCRLLGISDRTLYTLTQQGRLPSVRLSQRCIKYALSDIHGFINRCKDGCS